MSSSIRNRLTRGYPEPKRALRPEVLLLASFLVGDAGLAFGACTPAPTISRTPTVEASFWGLHLAAPNYLPWPAVSFASARTVATWPGVSWGDINVWNGYYDWSALDAYVSKIASEGKEILYTFINPPLWWTGYPSTSNLGPWTNFVKAIVARYCNVIKYWELWNEPNSPNSWTGTAADMVAMAKVAYPIIKNAGGIVVSPGPQGSSAWLRDFFSLGGGAYVDVVAIHGYTFGTPEKIVPRIQDTRAVMAAYGQSSKPLWDTERSFWVKGWTPGYGVTDEDQSKWLARHTILEASLGIERSYWFMWEETETLAGLWNRATWKTRTAGKVYQVVRDWLTGRTVSCTLYGDIYWCALGSSRAIAWHIKGWWQKITVDARYTKTQDAYGTRGTISGNQIYVTGIPVMIE